MRNTISLLASSVLMTLLVAGCAGPEQKAGRGFSNMTEIVRGGEMNRSVEQGGIFEGPDTGAATGYARGFDRTLARTGVGIYEVITFPFPPYGPIWTDYLSPRPLYPDSYHPTHSEGTMYDDDYSLGFSGGAIWPWIPGNRFRVFDN